MNAPHLPILHVSRPCPYDRHPTCSSSCRLYLTRGEDRCTLDVVNREGCMTLEEIGERFGVSREAIRTTLIRASTKLRALAQRDPSWHEVTVDARSAAPTLRPEKTNGRPPRSITAYGHTRTIAEWARVTGYDPSTIAKRLARGWDAERAVGEVPAERKGWA